ncbi:hypothetical protein K9L16_02655 [Candidatus Pacearchaeota archaeon]|nr:hypothetical protein [Candidatus Pacearchaeota archaeon]
MVNRSNIDFRTVSTKIRRDPTFLDFDAICKKENKTHSMKVKELIQKETQKKKKPYFYAGNIRVIYNPVLNNYSVKALLENGEEVIIWENLSEDFIKSLKDEIASAIQTRNHFVHDLDNCKNVAVPSEGIGGEDE